MQIAPGAKPGDPRQVTRVILYGENGIKGIAAMNDRGAFVSGGAPHRGRAGPAGRRRRGGEWRGRG